MKFYKSFFSSFNFDLLFFTCFLISSCGSSADKSELASSKLSVPLTANADTPVVQVPRFSSNNMEVKTYEVKDSTGKSQGWGYDIYIEHKKTIHQPIIPAIAGNRSFKTESDARKTALFALDKMIKEGYLPTLSIEELDSLGVTK